MNAAFVVLTALYYHASLDTNQSHPARPRGYQQSISNIDIQSDPQLQVSGQIVSVTPHVPDPVLVHELVPEPLSVTKEGSCQQPMPNNTPWLSSLHTWQVIRYGVSCSLLYSILCFNLVGCMSRNGLQDGRRRQYLGRLPQLQPQYCGPVSIDELDISAPVFATFTNAAPVYVEQLLNWAFHLRELQLPHVVVCLDNESEDIALSNGIPYVTVQNKTTSEDVRNDHATFRAMVSRKARPFPIFSTSFSTSFLQPKR